jgi:hypothetical protein
MPIPTPYVNIQNAQVTGTLTKNGTFYWYNPNSNDEAITIGNCGAWCVDSTYTIPAGSQQYVSAQILASPNENGEAWVEDPSGTWTGGGTGPHIVSQSGAPGTPIVNIQTGVVTGTLQNGQPFNWNNPNPGTVSISNCGAWCAAPSYSVTGSGLTAAAMATNPNTNGCSWTESPNRYTAPGMPHLGNPPSPNPVEVADKEVA